MFTAGRFLCLVVGVVFKMYGPGWVGCVTVSNGITDSDKYHGRDRVRILWTRRSMRGWDLQEWDMLVGVPDMHDCLRYMHSVPQHHWHMYLRELQSWILQQRGHMQSPRLLRTSM